MSEPSPTVSNTVAKIKSRGFWEVTIRPIKFDSGRLKSLSTCKELVEENRVLFRGWDYPHIGRGYDIRSGTDWVETLVDWSDHVEYWRMYKSAQFFHIFGCIEDWSAARIF